MDFNKWDIDEPMKDHTSNSCTLMRVVIIVVNKDLSSSNIIMMLYLKQASLRPAFIVKWELVIFRCCLMQDSKLASNYIPFVIIERFTRASINMVEEQPTKEMTTKLDSISC